MRAACSGCGVPTDDPGAFCDDCRGNYKDQMRLTGRTSPYSTQAWKKRAARFVRGKACVLCGRPAKVADHWPQERKDLVRAGVSDPDQDRYLRPLCLSCGGERSAQQTVRFDNDPA